MNTNESLAKCASQVQDLVLENLSLKSKVKQIENDCCVLDKGYWQSVQDACDATGRVESMAPWEWIQELYNRWKKAENERDGWKKAQGKSVDVMNKEEKRANKFEAMFKATPCSGCDNFDNHLVVDKWLCKKGVKCSKRTVLTDWEKMVARCSCKVCLDRGYYCRPDACDIKVPCPACDKGKEYAARKMPTETTPRK
jgi:hypothetical protein